MHLPWFLVDENPILKPQLRVFSSELEQTCFFFARFLMWSIYFTTRMRTPRARSASARGGGIKLFTSCLFRVEPLKRSGGKRRGGKSLEFEGDV